MDHVNNFVEESAEPQDGFDKFYEWVGKNIKYPHASSTNKKEGKVYVKFVVEPSGELTNIQLLKGFDTECDREAIRVISISPRWKPGKIGGKIVRQYYTVAIKFKLPSAK